MNKKVFGGAATLSGTIIGAGILGLPYVFSQTGFLIGWIWIIFFGIIMLVTYLYLSEVCLRTKENHQLPGLAEKYLGKKGKIYMLAAMIFGLYASLTAYLIGEGQSLSLLLFGSTNYNIYMTILFWLVLSILLEGGIDRLKRVEEYGLVAVGLIIIGIFIYFLGDIKISNLTYTKPDLFFLPLGVTLFALLGFTSIPEVREEMKGAEKHTREAIFIGILIPVILYIIFAASFIGVLGEGVSEIATLSFGPFIIILGIFTMFTSYFAISYSLKDVCKYDLKLGHRKTFILTSLIPISLFFFVELINWTSFTTIIGIGGVISGGAVGILSILMNYESKSEGDRHPEYEIPINIPIIVILISIFVLGVIVQLLNIIKG